MKPTTSKVNCLAFLRRALIFYNSDPHTLVIKGRTEREFYIAETSQGREGQGEGSDLVEMGDQSITKTKNRHRYWARERSVGEFHRSFVFPGGVDEGKVKTNLKHPHPLCCYA